MRCSGAFGIITRLQVHESPDGRLVEPRPTAASDKPVHRRKLCSQEECLRAPTWSILLVQEQNGSQMASRQAQPSGRAMLRPLLTLAGRGWGCGPRKQLLWRPTPCSVHAPSPGWGAHSGGDPTAWCTASPAPQQNG
jgi:hypothetical protein